jgi:histone-lysine N-methyltransferase SUV420H
MASKARPAKSALTLEKLASHDDVITDAVVDRVYYWTTIRKNRPRFSASRGIHEEDIADIIRKTVVVEKDPATAVTKLLQLPGLRSYVNRLPSQDDKDHFVKHMRRYVDIYMPDCPFEVTTTNRYMVSEHEASITARKAIKRGEEIKYLTGVQVALTKEQEETLDLARKDFSIVVSSRKKTRSLFLGPARFANHDCDANARLTTKGLYGMQVVSVKPIDAGEEITVSYGDDYFGENNEECLCLTCEKHQVNGWAPLKPIKDEEPTPPPEEDEAKAPKTGRGRKRKAVAMDEDNAQQTQWNTDDPYKDIGTVLILEESETVQEGNMKKRKADMFDEVPSQISVTASPRRSKKSKIDHPGTYSSSPLRHEVPLASVEDASVNAPPSPSILILEESNASRSNSPRLSQLSSIVETPKTDVTSVDGDTIMLETEQKVKIEEDHVFTKPMLEVPTLRANSSLLDDDTSSELSELSPTQELDDVLQQVVKRKRSKLTVGIRNTRSQSRRSDILRNTTPIIMDSTEAGYAANSRRPGDYTLTPLLLATKYSRWVDCRTCEADFVQHDAINTRAACPRCERHSKLYGYMWPKTDKEGKHDKEERILDHRTIHRFVEPQEEKQIKKGKAALQERVLSRLSSSSTPGLYRELSSSVEVEYREFGKRKRSRKTI